MLQSGLDFPERLVPVSIDHGAGAVGYPRNRAQPILEVIVMVSSLLDGQGIINPQGVGVSVLQYPVPARFGILRENIGAVIDIPGYLGAVGLLDPPSEWIILVIGNHRLPVLDLDQIVLIIVNVG